MRISLGDVSLWFDVSGPSVIPRHAGGYPARRAIKGWFVQGLLPVPGEERMLLSARG